jgi:spore maturation protein CgeB
VVKLRKLPHAIQKDTKFDCVRCDGKFIFYKIEKVIPSNQEEIENLCDIFNTPSLKSGYVEMVSAVSHYITKSEFNKIKKVYAKFYNKETNKFIEGSLFLNERLFAAL